MVKGHQVKMLWKRSEMRRGKSCMREAGWQGGYCSKLDYVTEIQSQQRATTTGDKFNEDHKRKKKAKEQCSYADREILSSR